MAKGENLIRLIRMLLWIEAHPGLSAKELAKDNGISERQVFRDIKALCYAGVPLYNDNGYRLLEKTGLRKISLTLEEAFALIYGIKLLEKQKGFLRASAGVKEKLLDLLPVPLKNELEDIQKQVDVSVGMTVDYSGKDIIFKRINTAIRNLQCVAMDYYSFSRDQISSRVVDPYQIVFREGFWYLVAGCHLREEIRLFRVDRIRHLELIKESFCKPKDFDLETYLGSAWQMERGEEFTFAVQLEGNAARYVQEIQFHPSQQVAVNQDGTILFTARACGIKSVARWVLQFGNEAEVLEPVELRNLVSDQIQGALEKYAAKKRDKQLFND